MNMIRTCTWLGTWAYTLLFSACAYRMNVSEKLMWSTYPLATERGTATGFIINYRDFRVAGEMVPVLFTSVHVLDTVGDGPLIIAYRTLDGIRGAEVSLLTLIPPKRRGEERFYVRHPSQDVAAIALPIPPDSAGFPLLPSALDQSTLAFNEQILRTGVEVSFLGYPEVLPGTDGAFAVLRSGRVSSYPVGTPQANGRFLINSDVYPGDSGAPVFLTSGHNRPKLVGMIVQRISSKADNFSHLAVAVDADVIRETLALLTTRNS